MTLELDFEQGRTSFEPGESVGVTVRWLLEEPQDRLDVRLIWYTSGRGDRDLSLLHNEQIEVAERRGERTLRFALPGGPYSFSGTLISIIWAVEVIAASGESLSKPFTLAPGGKEIVVKEVPR